MQIAFVCYLPSKTSHFVLHILPYIIRIIIIILMLYNINETLL